MWSLRYAGESYEFNHVSVTSVEVEGRSYRVDDATNPRSDGVTFGEDFADPGDVQLELFINFQHVRNLEMQRMMLREAASDFLASWDAVKIRRDPWGIAEFTIPKLGMFEGRPRRAEWDWSTFGLGYLVGAATFVRDSTEMIQLDDGGEASWHFVEVGIESPSVKSGWVFPLVFPLQNLEPVVKSTWLEVSGQDAWPLIEVSGPLQSGASLEVTNGWRIVLNRALAFDEVARIDTRPGRRISTVNDSPRNILAPSSSLLSELQLTPGPHQISLRGVSTTGLATARLSWRTTKAGI